MALTPDDIVGYEFRQQKVRGYDVEQVDELLDRLADQVERTDREADELRRRLREAETRLTEALETETSLKRTLVTAQDAAERALAEAREQADELRETAERAIDEQLARAREEARSLVADAQREARAELATASEQRAAVEARIAALRELEHRHRISLERHLRAQLDQLEELTADEDAPADTPAPSAGREPPAGEADAAADEPTSSHEEPRPDRGEAPSSPWEQGLTVRVRGTERAGGGEQQLGSDPPQDGGDGTPPHP